MGANWNLWIVAAGAFLFVLGLQSTLQKHLLNEAVRRYWNVKPEEAIKLVRQDVNGIIVAIGITNAFLAAILAILIYR